MTCKCVGGPDGAIHARREAAREREAYQQVEADRKARTADPNRFDIEDIEEIVPYLVMRVKYPSCTKCEYEGKKVMVFTGATLKDVLKWKVIDPHFRRPDENSRTTAPRAAPSPIARFPGSDEGWSEALAWVRWKTSRSR